MVKRNNNKKNLQDQLAKLNNEIEELRLEREESKKNVLHFMQEADTARHELSETKQLMKELKRNATPPLSASPSDQDDDEDDRISLLLLNPSDPKGFDTSDDKPEQEMQSKLKRCQLENAELAEELDQIRHEYQATRQALHIENERAETIENRWKESENNLEQAEITITQLEHDLEKYRQLDWSMKLANKEEQDAINRNEIETWKKKYQDGLVQADHTSKVLLERECEVKDWKDRYERLNEERVRSFLLSFCFMI
jgi:chromosome segregation ATPase